MIALLSLVVFGAQLADRTIRRGTAITWLVISVVTFVLTRSSTVFVVSSRRSASVDLPWSTWAMIQKFRIRLWGTGM